MRQQSLLVDQRPKGSRYRSTTSRHVRIWADLHVGSNDGLSSPEQWHLIPKKEIRKRQETVYNLWGECIDACSKDQPDLGISNGDAIDGDNYKEVGKNAWTVDLGEQNDEAVKLMRMHKYQNIVVTTGSGYHVKRGGTHFERSLAKELIKYETDGRMGREIRQDQDDTLERRKGNTRVDGDNYGYADYRWDFKMLGRIFNFTHHVGYSQIMQYRTTPLARELVTMELDAGKTLSTGQRYSFVIRSHTHYYVEIRYLKAWGCITPAWKFPDEFLLRRGLGGTAPTLGILEIILEPDGRREINVHAVEDIKYPKRRIPNATPDYKGPDY